MNTEDNSESCHMCSPKIFDTSYLYESCVESIMCDKNVIVENKGYRMGCLEHKIEWSESDYRSCPMCMQENDGKERERGPYF